MSEVFDRERPTFEESNNVTIQRCFYAYEFASTYIQGKTVADVGCGNGYGSIYMSGMAQFVTGLDYSAATVADNNERHKNVANLKFISCKVPPLALEDSSVDVVTAFQFIEHIHERAAFIRDVKRVLKPGGLFICTTPNIKMSIARNPFHVHEYTFDEMKSEMGNVFSNFRLMGLNGNDKVNQYYADNARWAKKILRLDPLGLHKLVPASWLVKPYNYLTSLMRKDLKDQNQNTLQITTADFKLQENDLDVCWDIFVVATKE